MADRDNRGGKQKEAGPRSLDPASQEMLRVAAEKQLTTAWDRYQNMQPQCRFGKQGVCCRICIMGPCRPKAIGEEEPVGVCGAKPTRVAS